MTKRLPLLMLAACAGCAGAAGDPQAPAVRVAAETDDPAAHIARMKAVIRQDAVTSYGAECGTIEVPDSAMIPIEITGGGLPEMAVTFGRVRCGIGATRFSGTGGVMVQFWIGSGGPVRLLLEQQMHGFTPIEEGLVTMQHGAFCPEGGGPDQCRITYEWDEDSRRLERIERRLASTPSEERMEYDWERISY